jgi:hypothetical protein
MYGDPRARFYYPFEIDRYKRLGFLVGFLVGALAGTIVTSLWLALP